MRKAGKQERLASKGNHSHATRNPAREAWIWMDKLRAFIASLPLFLRAHRVLCVRKKSSHGGHGERKPRDHSGADANRAWASVLGYVYSACFRNLELSPSSFTVQPLSSARRQLAT